MRIITNIALTALAVLSVGIAEKSATAMTAPTPENRLTDSGALSAAAQRSDA
jgi:hypothetical protein